MQNLAYYGIKSFVTSNVAVCYSAALQIIHIKEMTSCYARFTWLRQKAIKRQRRTPTKYCIYYVIRGNIAALKMLVFLCVCL